MHKYRVWKVALCLKSISSLVCWIKHFSQDLSGFLLSITAKVGYNREKAFQALALKAVIDGAKFGYLRRKMFVPKIFADLCILYL